MQDKDQTSRKRHLEENRLCRWKKTLHNLCSVKASQNKPPKKFVIIAKINTKLSLLEMCQARETLAEWNQLNGLSENFIKFCWGGVSQRRKLARGGGAGRKVRQDRKEVIRLQVSWVSDCFDRLGEAVCEKVCGFIFPEHMGPSWAVDEIIYLFCKLWFLYSFSVFQVVVSVVFHFSVLRSKRRYCILKTRTGYYFLKAEHS